MNLQTTFARHVALLGSMLVGSLWLPIPQDAAPSSDPQGPPESSGSAAPAPSEAPAAKDDATKATGDRFGETSERFEDALEAFGAERADAPGSAGPHDPLDAWMRALDGELGAHPLFQPFALRFDPRSFAMQPGGAGSFHSTTIENGETKTVDVEVAADGKATAKIATKSANGDTTENRIEAESLDALCAQSPEVKALVGGTAASPKLGAFPRARAFPFAGQPRAFAPKPSLPSRPFAAPRQDGGPRLGVQVRPIEADSPLRAHLRLDDGIGLLVESVVDGSLARELGIERNDVLVRVGDLDVRSPDDVRRALEQAGRGSIAVHVLRGGKPRVLSKDATVHDA